ncbi:MAG: tryptophan synthase subunit alpha [Candidatus Omnitrophota bacterium]|nr:tryptophan synthase subunit alpha [Candidatus Omnitrophota bacterium]
MNRIENKFIELRKAKKKAFIAFITAGFPDLKTTKELILEFDRIGVDIIELGVPFSDPLADGPIIQEATHFALKKGVSLLKILQLVKSVRMQVRMPICLMTYYNPVFCYGEEKFARQAARSGVDGVIISDLPPEEAKLLVKYLNRYGIDNINFLAPTSSNARIEYVSRQAQGFIYYVSLTGVTGERKKIALDLNANLRRIKKYTTKPVCVGFGVSTKKQVKEIQRKADGVIVGSAIVHKIKENIGRSDVTQRVSSFVSSLKGS